MVDRSRSLLALCAATVLSLGGATPATGQTTDAWELPRLGDGQPDLNGTWNNVGAAHIPLELPDELAGKTLSPEDIRALVQERSDARKSVTWQGHENSRGVGAYANYWFDWYWKEPAGVDALALLIEPATGKVPEMTPKAKQSVAYHREHLHDSYATMESGDRCVSRGTYGIMMPTAYNNGKMFFHTPGHVVILSEMIHNSRIIPIDAGHTHQRTHQPVERRRARALGRPHPDRGVEELQGGCQPAGAWITRAADRGAARRRAVHAPRRADTLRYELRVDDPETYTAPWAVSFNYKRDDAYVQYEYGCHEGNYAVPNSLSGQRAQERR